MATTLQICHTAIMLYGHRDTTVLYTCVKTQPTLISTSQVIPMYVLITNMPL